MKILMVTAEAYPFAKSGGLADAVSALSKSIFQMGYDVRIFLPRYYRVNPANLELVAKNLPVQVGNTEIHWNLYKSVLPDVPVPVYFFDYEKFFGRDSNLYGSKTEPDYRDNPLRFATFNRAAFELCKYLNWIPDIMHCHDWSSSFATVVKKFHLAGPEFRNTKTVLTIHNMGYQGFYSIDALKTLGIDEVLQGPAGLTHTYGMDFLKAGITCADKITTVSETYAKEIQTPYGGFSLDGLMRYRSLDLTGIVNGADTTEWNPANDPLIPANFSKDDLSGKAKCKADLQKRFGLKVKKDVPLVGIMFRLADQKGINELFAPMYGCMWRMATELNAQFVVCGNGEEWCQNEIAALAKKLPNMGAFIGYNEDIGHKVEAGSDLFLMPSKYEPCGLNQIYSMLYGALPIVRNTGGLADTVSQYDEWDGTGTGFKFNDLTPDAIFNTVKWALGVYTNRPDHYKKMQVTAMSQTFGWEDSAKKYIKVYESADPISHF